jgi:hypothetical protein
MKSTRRTRTFVQVEAQGQRAGEQEQEQEQEEEVEEEGRCSKAEPGILLFAVKLPASGKLDSPAATNVAHISLTLPRR